MDFQFFRIGDEDYIITNIDYSGLTLKRELDTTLMIYRWKLSGNVVIFGNDFEYFKDRKLAGFLTVLGKFKINGVVPFGISFSNIKYKLDSKKWNFTDNIVELEIIAEDNYFEYDTKADKKINLFDLDI